ncbi:MAG: vitamin B12-dependent ribonucleotide reductase, partial [Acidobacteria bacterium]|nr:vitamin B12-dependent ribonucleotide reductase [Acidobacteriota bacterium]
LQYGVPLQVLVDKFSHARFEPSGMTKNPEVRFAKSIVDYIFRWMATKFLSPEAQFRAGVNLRTEPLEAGGAGEAGKVGGAGAEGLADGRRDGPSLAAEASAKAAGPPEPASRLTEFAAIQNQEDAPPCSTCGSLMIRSGSCYTCTNCGTTSGCA